MSNDLETGRAIMPVAGEQSHLPADLVDLQPMPVELRLMHKESPAGGDGRKVGRQGSMKENARDMPMI